MSTGDGEPAASTATKQQARRGLADGKGKKMTGKEKAAAKDDDKAEGKGGKKKKIIMIAPVLVIVLAAAWFLFLKPSSGSATEKPKPVPGVIATIEPITINLAGGHFLKLGLALQADKSMAEAPDGAKALDAAISLYSGMTIQELASKHGRDKSKTELVKEVYELYEQKVYDVYFTEFVYQ